MTVNKDDGLDWCANPVILRFDMGMSIITYIAFTENQDVVMVKNAFLISRTMDGNMVMVKYLPECSNEVFPITANKIFTLGTPCKEVMKTYMRVVFGKSEFDTEH